MSLADKVINQWDDLHEGKSVTLPLLITDKDMQDFIALSGDTSRIHVDAEFAVEKGFKKPIVYGALTLAKMSKVFGGYLPGDLGMSTSWKIDFNQPLYVGDEATIFAEVVHKSESTRTVKIKFKISVSETLIANGSAVSMLLE